LYGLGGIGFIMVVEDVDCGVFVGVILVGFIGGEVLGFLVLVVLV